jgi:uncharacterized protein (TIGR03083 family)
VRRGLVELLGALRDDEWAAPTVCERWDVKGVALHLLGGEIANLSRRRDGLVSEPPPGTGLAPWLNVRNEEWVRAARFVGNRTLVELLDFAGSSFEAYLATLDLDAETARVSWASDEPVPVWLDVARELTERWVHQQQIRDATARPGLKEPDVVRAVVGTFVHALPRAYRGVDAPDGAAVVLRVEGDGGGEWHVRQVERAWVLAAGAHEAPRAVVELDEDDAWRLFTRNPHAGEPRVQGDHELARPLVAAVAVVA